MKNRDQMIREIGTLASGTIASLCGSPNYEDIEAFTQEWVEWILSQDEQAHWCSWQCCHAQFSLALTAQWGVSL